MKYHKSKYFILIFHLLKYQNQNFQIQLSKKIITHAIFKVYFLKLIIFQVDIICASIPFCFDLRFAK